MSLDYTMPDRDHVPRSLPDRFAGCLLGLAIGDSLGSHFEGQSPEYVARQVRSVEDLFLRPPRGEMWYTDDTQMAIGVAETLVACGAIENSKLCERFAANYAPERGYGRGARAILQAMVDGEDHQLYATNYFPGGSFGNGAAMRVAPIGVFFRDDHDVIWEQARLSSLPTHVHPLGVEGAQLIALAVALASATERLDRSQFLSQLAARCTSLEYSGPLRRAVQIQDRRDLALFGNGIEATSSVVTAIASFVLTPESYKEAIGNVILIGGDTDTIAAMAGAISGAYLGLSALPERLLDVLEDGYQGRRYIQQLAADLLSAYERKSGAQSSTSAPPLD